MCQCRFCDVLCVIRVDEPHTFRVQLDGRADKEFVFRQQVLRAHVLAVAVTSGFVCLRAGFTCAAVSRGVSVACRCSCLAFCGEEIH